MADIPVELIEHLSKEFSKACTPFDFKDSTIKVVEAACKETEKKEKKRRPRMKRRKKKLPLLNVLRRMRQKTKLHQRRK